MTPAPQPFPTTTDVDRAAAGVTRGAGRFGDDRLARVVPLAAAIRRHAVRMAATGRSSHVASALSAADIVAVLYGAVMHHDPARPDLPDRDRFLLSKGHAGSIVYAVLAELGYFPTELLSTHCANGSALSGHVSHAGVPGVELSTGSLGHALAVGAGMALHSARRQWPYRTFVVLGDGECAEGSVWETALFAAHHRLSGLVAVVDANGLQGLGTTDEVLGLEPFVSKWQSFGWDTVEVDGHNCAALTAALDVVPVTGGRPRCVLARTVKGRGVSFMEGDLSWHYRSPGPDELAQALSELSGPGDEP